MIDLDRDFRLFAAKLLSDAGEVKEEDTEAFLNSATERWLARKNPLLDGLTPDEYFGRMEPDELVSWLKECCAKRYSVPEPLYRKISATRECESALCALAAGDAGDDTRATALSLLIEMDSPYADKACVVNAVRGEKMETILPAIRKDLSDFEGETDQFDDITMLGFAFFGTGQENGKTEDGSIPESGQSGTG